MLRLLFKLTLTLGVTVLILAGMLLYLVTAMPGSSLEGELPPLDAELVELRNRLQSHVGVLAERIGPRHAARPEALDRAADYVLEQFSQYGYAPVESRFGAGRFRNIDVDLHGSDRTAEIIVIGAHYDTAANGTPGADDNASGVAAMLEIARLLSTRQFSRGVRFVAFPNEERPYFGTDLMGSRVTAQLSAARQEQLAGMFSLEMLGYYSSAAGSQRYPPVIGAFYPRRGNFIAFVSNFSSRPLLREAVRSFRRQELFPSEGMAAPQDWVPDIRRSDNSSYWDFGFPAVMVTDTSNFRTPNYHTLNDTADSLDYDSMARVVLGLAGMVGELAGEPQ